MSLFITFSNNLLLMKVNVIKDHFAYPKGVVDVPEQRAKYLIAVGVAHEAGNDEDYKNLEAMYGNNAKPSKPKDEVKPDTTIKPVEEPVAPVKKKGGRPPKNPK